MDSDENFMLYRRFGFLYSRILLNKQDELREIDKSLDQMDKNDSARSKDSALCLQWRAKDASRKDIEPKLSRQELLRTSEEKLNQYSTFKSRSIQSMKLIFWKVIYYYKPNSWYP